MTPRGRSAPVCKIWASNRMNQDCPPSGPHTSFLFWFDWIWPRLGPVLVRSVCSWLTCDHGMAFLWLWATTVFLCGLQITFQPARLSASLSCPIKKCNIVTFLTQATKWCCSKAAWLDSPSLWLLLSKPQEAIGLRPHTCYKASVLWLVPWINHNLIVFFSQCSSICDTLALKHFPPILSVCSSGGRGLKAET